MLKEPAINSTIDWADVSKDHETSEAASKHIVFLAVILLLMAIFFMSESLMHRFKPRIGHETGATILLGIIFSLAYFKWHGETTEDYDIFQFRPRVFFDFILPPIIFNSGYNMRQKKFFNNIGNIMITGLGVTFVCFTIYSVATYFVLAKTNITMTRYFNNLDPTHVTPETYRVEIPFINVLMFTALVCSSDVVAAVSIVDFNEQPKLYSCIFGEGIVNDIVSIVLFNTVEHLQQTKFTRSTPWLIIG
jgi:NhaP-type Na+/H+ or K+/H+ antiporter